jgi:hypothetical protein
MKTAPLRRRKSTEIRIIQYTVSGGKKEERKAPVVRKVGLSGMRLVNITKFPGGISAGGKGLRIEKLQKI